MAAPLSTVLAQALELPDHERVELAERLLRSVGPEDDEKVGEAEWQQEWTAELDRRVEDMRNNPDELIDGDQVFAEVRAMLREHRR